MSKSQEREHGVSWVSWHWKDEAARIEDCYKTSITFSTFDASLVTWKGTKTRQSAQSLLCGLIPSVISVSF